jgi:hypothetical protein
MSKTHGPQAEEYSERVTQRRFKKLVHAALNTRPKPLKSMTPKRGAMQRKGRKKTAP